MKILTATSMLLGASFASPITYVSSGISGHSYYSNDSLVACINAPNCELIETNHGFEIAFKPGMEPGSKDYNSRLGGRDVEWDVQELVYSRQNEDMEKGIRTYIQHGPRRTNYGTADPQEVLMSLFANGICGPSTCDTAGSTYEITVVGALCPESRGLILEPHGQYNGEKQMKYFGSALWYAMGHNVEKREAEWKGVTDPNQNLCGSGTNVEQHQTSFVATSRYVDGFLQGYLAVSIVADEETNDCDRALETASVLTGMVSGVAASFFGMAKFACKREWFGPGS